MSFRMAGACILIASAGLTTGCAHTHLRNNAVNQAQTLSELYRQQVLNNLAQAVYDPHALPSFAVANGGSSDVGHLSDLRLGVGVVSVGFDTFGMNLRGQRTSKEAWTLSPISEPQRLALMRRAYQRALGSCGLFVAAGCCPHCQRGWESSPGDPICHDRVDVAAPHAAGPIDCCWFQWGCKRCLSPHDDGYVGKHGDVYVWVPPSGRDELTNLILEILDYALNNPPSAPRIPAVALTEYLDATNHYTTPDKAAKVIVSNVRRESIFAVPAPSDGEAVPGPVRAPAVLVPVPTGPAPSRRRSGGDPLQYLLRDELYRDTLTPAPFDIGDVWQDRMSSNIIEGTRSAPTKSSRELDAPNDTGSAPSDMDGRP